MAALGSDFNLKDGKLFIQGNKWLQPIANGYPALEQEYLRLEPAENGLNKTKSEAFASVRAHWGGRRDLNSQPSGPQPDALPIELLPPY